MGGFGKYMLFKVFGLKGCKYFVFSSFAQEK